MREFNVVEYGAVADGITNNARAIQRAVDDCNAAGGGRVTIPAGEYMSGSIQLKSNVDLHLEMGAVLISSLKEEDIDDFMTQVEDDNLCTGWEGGCFLGAIHAENVSLSGDGTIYGQGEKVFYDDGADGGFAESPLCVADFRPRMILFEDIQNLSIKDITLKDAAFWTLHMAGCRHVRINNIRILNDVRGANNDGIDPDCCQDVIISNCIVEAGDDAIVVKATKPMTARYGACENVVITGCILHSHDSALKIGTETHGTIRNVSFGDCIIKDCSRAASIWVRDGGLIEDIHVHHLTGAVRRYADAPGRCWWGKGEPLFISATYRNAEKKFPGTVRNISYDHIYLKAESCVFMGAEEDCPIEDIFMDHVHIIMEKQGTQSAIPFDEQPSMYNVYEHDIPYLYARYVNRLKVTDSSICHRGEGFPMWVDAIQLEHCIDAELEIEHR